MRRLVFTTLLILTRNWRKTSFLEMQGEANIYSRIRTKIKADYVKAGGLNYVTVSVVIIET